MSFLSTSISFPRKIINNINIQSTETRVKMRKPLIPLCKSEREWEKLNHEDTGRQTKVEATHILSFIIPKDSKGRFYKGEECSCQPQYLHKVKGKGTLQRTGCGKVQEASPINKTEFSQCCMQTTTHHLHE